jgi:NAD(P)-dependent dehydrogenase (short-subunit alcohol dehydrogenase family)
MEGKRMAREQGGAVLVTGASNGIGRAVAARAIQDGFFPVNLDLTAPAEKLPGEVFYRVDLTDAEATRAVLAEVVAKHAPLRLVNNAGMVRPASLEETTPEDLEAVVALNLRAPLLCAQALLPGMREARFGRIVNIASRAALGKELRSAYASTKAGLIGLTRTWALELAPQGITVNAIGPGPIGTELFHRANPHNSPKTRAIIEGVPVRRLGTPEDIAHAVAFFLDDRAGFTTGQVIYVCGGMTVGLAPA